MSIDSPGSLNELRNSLRDATNVFPVKSLRYSGTRGERSQRVQQRKEERQTDIERGKEGSYKVSTYACLTSSLYGLRLARYSPISRLSRPPFLG